MKQTTVHDGFAPAYNLISQDATAPGYKTLRPLPSQPFSPCTTFPVYSDLVNRLLIPQAPAYPSRVHPDMTIAHVLATCAGYAYSDAVTVAIMMERMGLEGNRCRMVGQYVDAMFIVSTAFIVQSADGKVVILAYRGTQPSNVINWLTDADLHPDKVGFKIGDKGPYDVHAGFYRNVRATRFAVADALARARSGRPVIDPPKDEPDHGEVKVNPMEALYITGHSLGGAMATVMAIMIQTEQAYRDQFQGLLKGVYTFGQPMVGSPSLAKACNGETFLRENVIRLVYQKDPAPHLPPADAGKFQNFGKEYQFSGGAWRSSTVPQMGLTIGLIGGVAAFAARQLPVLSKLPFHYQFDDHGPQHYIAALTPEGVRTEFGDYDYTSPAPKWM